MRRREHDLLGIRASAERDLVAGLGAGERGVHRVKGRRRALDVVVVDDERRRRRAPERAGERDHCRRARDEPANGPSSPHDHGSYGRQNPPRHVPPVHGMPSVTAVKLQRPVSKSHASVVHSLVSSHVTGVPGSQGRSPGCRSSPSHASLFEQPSATGHRATQPARQKSGDVRLIVARVRVVADGEAPAHVVVGVVCARLPSQKRRSGLADAGRAGLRAVAHRRVVAGRSVGQRRAGTDAVARSVVHALASSHASGVPGARSRAEAGLGAVADGEVVARQAVGDRRDLTSDTGTRLPVQVAVVATGGRAGDAGAAEAGLGAVAGSPSPHGWPSVTAVCWQPSAGSQESVVHGLASSQASSVPGVQTAPRQTSAPLQRLRSSHGRPSATAVC
jgi:hypothetical protein